MMKKTLILAAVMLLALGVAANAWVVGGSAKSLAGTLGMTAISFGNPSTSYLEHPPATPGTVQLALPRDGKLLYRWFQADVPASTVWTILFWGNGFAEPTARVRFWISQSTGIDTRPWELRNAATNELLWSGAVDTTKNAETKPWVDVVLPVVNTTTPFENATVLTFGPVPEPGSVVALCSGLIGLVGFGIRRRK